MPPTADVLRLERAALVAWPAAEAETRGGWVLRAMQGVTRRANSAWTSETSGSRPLGKRIAEVEAFYAARHLPSYLTLSPLSPPDLDRDLERRGYVLEAPVSIQTADASALASEATHEAVLASEPSRDFLAVVVERGRYARVPEAFLGLLRRLGRDAVYASIALEGEACAAGLGVRHGDLFGIFGMLTLEHARRRGLGRSVVAALARAAREGGARTLYLQVERENPRAHALYAGLGFREAYGYHYRVRREARPLLHQA